MTHSPLIVDRDAPLVVLERGGTSGPRLHPADRRLVVGRHGGPRVDQFWVPENLVESRTDARASAPR